MANRLRGEALAPVLHVGYGYLAAFAGAYVLVVLETQAYIGPVHVPVLIEAFAAAVAVFWWRYRPSDPLRERPNAMALPGGVVLVTWGLCCGMGVRFTHCARHRVRTARLPR